MKEKFEKLENLEEEKKLRIINAALQEFANNEYSKASTNRIVKEARIGKGMLFYYFNNKEDLYYYLINYSLDIVLHEFLLRIDDQISDFLDRLSHISKLKLNYFWKYPEVNKFLGTIMLREQLNLPPRLDEKYQRAFVLGNEKIYKKKAVDSNVFREDIEPEHAYQLMEWAIKGYQQDTLQHFSGKKMTALNLQKMWDEFDEYLDTLRTAFYK